MTLSIDTDSLGPHPNPAGNYAAAMKLVGVLQLADAIAAPGGESIVLVHGKRTARAIVLFHGFTNSPHQFRRIAETLYERGDNVVAPRLVYHGLRDGTVHELANLTAEQLRDHADTAIDIAQGLGGSVIAAGLSLGGNLAAWSAQMRPRLRERSRSPRCSASRTCRLFPTLLCSASLCTYLIIRVRAAGQLPTGPNTWLELTCDRTDGALWARLVKPRASMRQLRERF